MTYSLLAEADLAEAVFKLFCPGSKLVIGLDELDLVGFSLALNDVSPTGKVDTL